MQKPGIRARVNAHCVSCIYDSLVEGSWRQQVSLCTVTSCPIWDIRANTRANSCTSKVDADP